jgi:hypothetical protein
MDSHKGHGFNVKLSYLVKNFGRVTVWLESLLAIRMKE